MCNGSSVGIAWYIVFMVSQWTVLSICISPASSYRRIRRSGRVWDAWSRTAVNHWRKSGGNCLKKWETETNGDILCLFTVLNKWILKEKVKSGWCSGYHARFTRERSRVQSPHPILFLLLIVNKLFTSVSFAIQSHSSQLSTVTTRFDFYRMGVFGYNRTDIIMQTI